MSTDLPRIWHRWQTVPAGMRVRDALGRAWLADPTASGHPAFTDGIHTVHPRDLEYPLEEA